VRSSMSSLVGNAWSRVGATANNQAGLKGQGKPGDSTGTPGLLPASPIRISFLLYRVWLAMTGTAKDRRSGIRENYKLECTRCTHKPHTRLTPGSRWSGVQETRPPNGAPGRRNRWHPPGRSAGSLVETTKRGENQNLLSALLAGTGAFPTTLLNAKRRT